MEKRWRQFKKNQQREAKLQKMLGKVNQFKDVDPRPLIRPWFEKKEFKKSLKNNLRFIKNEIKYYRFKKNYPQLDRPIFVVGLPHSGTTISMKLLALHPDLANASELNTYFHPNNYLDLNNCEHIKEEKDCNEVERARLHDRMSFENFKRGNKPRFMNKNPNNTVTIRFLKECFPDCFIINVIRDGRAVVNSLINGLPDNIEKYDRYKKPNERVNSFPGVKPPDWRELLDEDPVLQHAKQWNSCINYVNANKSYVQPKYIELFYEKLCENPRAVIISAWQFVGLPVNQEISELLPEKLESKNYKYSQTLKDEDIEAMTIIMQKNLSQYGYI